MAQIIIMPKQGLLMEEGTITQWFVNEGEKTTEGQPLFEMETDKLTISMDSTATGTLLKILHPVGDTVPITEPIAVVGEPGEDISALTGNSSTVSPAPEMPEPEVGAELSSGVQDSGMKERVFSSPRARLRAEELGIDLSKVKGTGPDGIVVEKDVLNYSQSGRSITPLAANVAKVENIDLSQVNGTGPNGKITTNDLNPVSDDASAPIVRTQAVSADSEQTIHRTHTERMTGMRKAVMKNMLASKAVNAQTNHRISVDMEAVVSLRGKYQELGIKVSYNDIIVRACAKALRDMPIVNASVNENEIVYHDYVNIGTAVSVPGGLIVPVIKDADTIGLEGIAAKSSELIDKARDGQLTEEDYHGGTFTVSSLGMFDLDDFVAIINPPESAILAVGKIEKRPVVETTPEGEDRIVVKKMCNICLSYDHRIIDGAEGAKFLRKVKQYLQNPVLMI